MAKKIVADMFGLALRTYQRRVQRLESSATDSSATLWQAVNDFLQKTVNSLGSNSSNAFDTMILRRSARS